MSRKAILPHTIIEALTLREAGYTILAISQRLGISPRTLERHLAKHGAKKGSLKEEAIEAARAELLMLVTSDETIQAEAAKMLADDIAQARELRHVVMRTMQHLQARSLPDAVLVMRAAAAASTALKNTSDLVRHSLRADRATDNTRPLPELVIAELTASDIAELATRSPGELEPA